MPNTFQLIAATTLSSPASSIDFTSIPATYTDLCLQFSLRATNSSSARAEDALILAINNNTTGTNYNSRYIRGNGSNAGSTTASSSAYAGSYVGEINGSTSTASTFTSGEIYIPNYLSSTVKSFSVDIVQEANSTTAYSHYMANIWNQTNAITRLTLTDYNNNTFATNSTAYLYGVKNS
jgi:hypothetical protein